MLEYIKTGHKIEDRQDKLIDMIDSEVSKANSDKDWRKQAMGFMTLEHDFAVREEYARKEGLEEGQDKMAALGKALIGDGRSKDLEQAFSDPSFRDELYKEYGL